MKITLLSIVICVITCFAQTPGPAFEVASIRVAASDPRGMGSSPPPVQTLPGSLTIRNQPLLFLIVWAYDTQPFQIDGPAWLRDNRFDVVAKAGGTADDAQMKLMLRRLLAERFGMKAHTEQKEMPVYALTLAKGGPKFHESPDEGPPVFARGGPTMLTAHRVTMKDFAIQISEPLRRPVIDETGLTGRYEIHIDISGYMADAAANGGGDGGGAPDVMSILFTGLQEQLGVKLDSRRENVNVLVIDHAEKMPTEN